MPALATVALMLLVGACDLLPRSRAAAVWTVAPDQQLDASTSRLTVLVSRIGCNSGVTGQVQEPAVDVDVDEVTLTFTVSPGPPRAATCQGNDEVEFDVVLPEPLGDRRLVDGQCAAGREANGTSWCDPDGVRHRP